MALKVGSVDTQHAPSLDSVEQTGAHVSLAAAWRFFAAYALLVVVVLSVFLAWARSYHVAQFGAYRAGYAAWGPESIYTSCDVAFRATFQVPEAEFGALAGTHRTLDQRAFWAGCEDHFNGHPSDPWSLRNQLARIPAK